MRPGIYYLPEHHDFEYIARAPWPHIYTDYQGDWVNAITTLEIWLNSHIGAHYSHWAYAQQQEQNYWEACVAFKQARYKTLFLLQWT